MTQSGVWTVEKVLGILPKFWARPKEKRSSIVGSATWWQNFTSGFSVKSGATVNSSTAQSIPAYFRAVNIVCESIASLPWDVYERKSDGVFVAEKDPIRRLIKGRPSPLYDNFTFRDLLVRLLMTKGDAYCIIHRSKSGFPVELEVWTGNRPDMFLVDEPGTERQYFYKFENSPSISQNDVIHIRAWSTEKHRGNDALLIAREALGQAISQIEYGASFYGNGAHVSGSIETEKNLTYDQKQSLNQSIGDVSGADNVGNILILDNGLNYKHIGINPKDADLAAGRRLSTEDIANITGVPVFLLNNLERATFSNIEHLDRTFVQYCLRMHCKRLESEFSTKLFPRSQWGKKYIKFNLEGLLRGDTESRAKFYTSMFQIGAMSPNDIRKKENENPYEDGDKYYVPLNMATPDMIAQNQTDGNGE